MTFTRFKTTNFFTLDYTVAGGPRVILYCPNRAGGQVMFDNNLVEENDDHWVLCIIKGEGNLGAVNPEYLDRLMKIEKVSAIAWFDSFEAIDSVDYQRRLRCIKLKGNKVYSYLLTPNAGVGATTRYRMEFGGLKGSTIQVSAERVILELQNAPFFKVNNCRTDFQSLYLDLDPTSERRGALHLEAVFKKDSFIIPQIAFVRGNGEIVGTDVLDRSGVSGTTLNGVYFPFEGLVDDKPEYFGDFSFQKIGLKTNFLDTRGTPYLLAPSDQLRFCLLRIEDKYVLRPLGTMVLKNSGATALLAGRSGTETFSHESGGTEIEFTDQQIAIDGTQGEAGPDEKVTGLLARIKGATSYNIDSEGAPAFPNEVGTKENQEPDPFVKEIPYEPVIFRSNPDVPVPLLPTRGLRKGGVTQDIEEENARRTLEGLFKKVRQRTPVNPAALSNDELKITGHITPQGFIKKTSAYEFIDNASEIQGFRFNLNNPDISLETSLRSDEVFFVLTPSLFKAYQVGGGGASLDAVFAVNIGQEGEATFVVNLTTAFQNLPDGTSPNDCIVIFKFHRQSFNDLIADPSLWTNGGLFRIKGEMDKAKEAIEAASKFHEEYFDSLRIDENWNGVVILNIPAEPNGTPTILKGVGASQNLFGDDAAQETDKLRLNTKFKFQYAAFPINKTKIVNGKIEIESTSFYGMLDYAPFLDAADYKAIADYFPATLNNESEVKFVLSKLKVIFANSSIRSFQSYTFLQVPSLFEDSVAFEEGFLKHPEKEPPDATVVEKRPNLLMLDGKYQKNSAGAGQIDFSVNSVVKFAFPDSKLIEFIEIRKIGFGLSLQESDRFRFDLDGEVRFAGKVDDAEGGSAGNLFSFRSLKLRNIGFEFNVSKPFPKLELSRLLVFPDIDFDHSGLLSSFPIRFSHFRSFSFTRGVDDFDFGGGDFDFLRFGLKRLPDLELGKSANLFSFIFDFDLGTLGDLGGLKALKGQLLLGWSVKGGFTAGLKLAGGNMSGFHVNLFGAIKIDVEKIDLCQVDSGFIIRILDARVTVFGLEIPKKDEKPEPTINAIIFAKPGSSVAWLMSYERKFEGHPGEPPPKPEWLLGVGQRVGPDGIEEIRTVKEAVGKMKEKVFDPNLQVCGGKLPDFYKPHRNWLIGSDAFLPKDLPIELAFIFNDPVLYGLHLGFKGEILKGLSLDILYKKLSDNLGVYSVEIQLPDAIRSKDVGGAYFRLPNLGIEIYTNGDWKSDLGFPKENDWSRSGFLQLRTVPPMVGWFGFYLMRSKVASLTLFNGYIGDAYSRHKLSIVQAGFALRVGVGTYLDGGIFYVGASISVYGILEGAFAFEKGEKGLDQFFPDHIAVFGRVGAIAELVGYVNFFIIQASVYISLRVEFGFKFVVLSRPGNYRALDSNNQPILENGAPVVFNPTNPDQAAGLQPVVIYVEGQVIVQVCIKIGCIKIRLGFSAFVRFEFAIGGNGGTRSAGLSADSRFRSLESPRRLDISINGITSIPMVYLPAFTKTESSELQLIHTFMIPFFGTHRSGDGEIQFPANNIVITKVLRPFFTDLIRALQKENIQDPSSYDTLRSVLQSGRCVDIYGRAVDVDISVPGYCPSFIKDINTPDEAEIAKIVQNLFGFSQETALAPVNNGSRIVDRYGDDDPEKSCLYMIPAPISPRINFLDNDGRATFSAEDLAKSENLPFTIVLEHLVDTNFEEDTITHKLTTKIEPIRKSPGYLEGLEEHFKDYKTQFFERQKKAQPDLANLTLDPDLRTNVIVPEFFKLFALVALEAFHASCMGRTKEKVKSPVITPAATEGVFHWSYTEPASAGEEPKKRDEDWIPSGKNLEGIIGQLNYFYNSGLRLPLDPTKATSKSEPIFHTLGQSVRIQPIKQGYRSPELVALVKVSFQVPDRNAETKEVDMTEQVFMHDAAKQDMLKLIDQLDKGFKPDYLIREFRELNETGEPIEGDEIKFPDPYQLMDVNLAIQDSELEIKTPEGENKVKFFNLPPRLLSNSELYSRYEYQLNVAAYKDDKVLLSTSPPQDGSHGLNHGLLIGATFCLNVELKVKKHLYEGSKCRLLEIVNVMVDDLNLVTALNQASMKFSFGCVEVYHKATVAGQENQKPRVELVHLSSWGHGMGSNFSMVKANLSPRTNPPMFDVDLASAHLTVAEDFYIAGAAETQKFVHLLWESLSTNNGGYYIVFNNDLEAPTLTASPTQETIMLSFTVAPGQLRGVPAFFNGIKVVDNPDFKPGAVEQNKSLFEALKDKGCYLFLDRIFEITGNTVEEQMTRKVCEYHATIPAHCFGFSLRRDRRRNLHHPSVTTSPSTYAGYLNYLPLEFSIKGEGDEPVLNENQVLPIMPTSPSLPDTTYQEEVLNYDHVCPLISVSDFRNLDRYSVIGKKFEVKVGLRDVFGFRAPMEQFTRTYTHSYSDKIIGMEAWPLCHLSYWFGSFKNRVITFNLHTEFNLLEIQDLAGIKRKTNDSYATGYGDKVEDTNHAKQLHDAIPGVLDTLYLVLAQLTDKNLVVETKERNDPYKEDLRAAVKDLTEKLETMERGFLSNREMKFPSKVKPIPLQQFPFSLGNKELEKEIDISVTLRRDQKLTAGDKGNWKDKTVWEFDSTYESRTRIMPRDPDSRVPLQKSALADLNNLIRSKTLTGQSPLYCLAISADKKNRKITYLVNEGGLSMLKPVPVENGKFKGLDCYYGIRPFSGKLWSGSFANGDTTAILSNVDLEKSLHVVLKKMDELLDPVSVSEKLKTSEDEDAYRKLLKCKKNLAKNRLAHQIAKIQEPQDVPARLTQEFGQLLLSGLGNFHSYDGIVYARMEGFEIPRNHRLNISVDSIEGTGTTDGYQFVSSKIESVDASWIVLFDRLGRKVNDTSGALNKISFTLKPRITHIEILRPQTIASEIEESQWIQLLLPVFPGGSDKGRKPAEYKVESWEPVIREFPPKPTIAAQTAIQSALDIKNQDWSPALGKWNYEVSIINRVPGEPEKPREALFNNTHSILVEVWKEKQADSQGDNSTRALVASGDELKAFVAYWASIIAPNMKIGKIEGQTTSQAFDWKVFTAQLYSVLFPEPALKASPEPVESIGQVNLVKKERWVASDSGGLEGKVSVEEFEGLIKIKIKGFDLFKKSEVIRSLKASVQVTGNILIPNKDFHYTTEQIFAPEVVTPSIRFFNPIRITSDKKFKDEVFSQVEGMPFKAMAKYLLDLGDGFPESGKQTSLVPVHLTESMKGAIRDPDGNFKDHLEDNGYFAYSLVVYNPTDKDDTPLPVFQADTIYKARKESTTAATHLAARSAKMRKVKAEQTGRPQAKKKSKGKKKR